MRQGARLKRTDRRAAILEAATPLFAEQGFHGVSIRQIADAARVSEALLYRHFASKEALFEAIQDHCMHGVKEHAEQLSKVEPSTSTLVLAVYLVAHKIVRRPGESEPAQPSASIPRLMINSLAADGDFARGFLKQSFQRWFPKLRECVAAARAAGDIVGPEQDDDVAFWLVHHVAVMTRLMRLPHKPAVAYGVAEDDLVARVARFALRGLGLTEEALARHFNPKALSVAFK